MSVFKYNTNIAV